MATLLEPWDDAARAEARERRRELAACRGDPRQFWIPMVAELHATRPGQHTLARMTTRQLARRLGA